MYNPIANLVRTRDNHLFAQNFDIEIKSGEGEISSSLQNDDASDSLKNALQEEDIIAVEFRNGKYFPID